jgi:predicted Zn-dependent protease
MNYEWFRKFIARGKRSAPPVSPEGVLFVETSFRRKFDSDIQKARSPIKNPERFHAWSAAAQIAMLRGDPEQVIALTDQMTAEEPDRALPWTIRAQALLALHRLHDAIGAAEQAIRIDPSDPGKWELMAAFLRLDGRDLEAAECDREGARLKR